MVGGCSDQTVVACGGGMFAVEPGDDARPVKLAEPAVDLGDLGGKVLAVAFRQATHHIELLHTPFSLGLGVFKYGVYRLLFRVADKSTGVYYHNRRGAAPLRRIVTRREAVAAQHSQQALRIDKIL